MLQVNFTAELHVEGRRLFCCVLSFSSTMFAVRRAYFTARNAAGTLLTRLSTSTTAHCRAPRTVGPAARRHTTTQNSRPQSPLGSKLSISTLHSPESRATTHSADRGSGFEGSL